MTTAEIQEMKDNYALYFPELNRAYAAVASKFQYFILKV